MTLETTCRYISQLSNNKSNGTQLITMLNQVMHDLNTNKYCVLSGKLHTLGISMFFKTICLVHNFFFQSIPRSESYYSFKSGAVTSRSTANL